jgi:uncharacterized protein YodC (DUF2158 family)
MGVDVGDVVKLKSGGELMTVRATGVDLKCMGIEGGVLCLWFENHQLRREIFPPEMLVNQDESIGDLQ